MSTKHFIAYKQYECKMGIGEYAAKGSFVPQETIDAAADASRDQGWTKQLKRRNLCNTCFTYMTKSNTCLCE